MRRRHEYVVDVGACGAALGPLDPNRASSPNGGPSAAADGKARLFTVRPVVPADREALAQLMLDAYRGTIDSDGEDLAGAFAEIDSFLTPSATSAPRLDDSRVVCLAGSIRSACLVSEWRRRDCPLVSYVVTEPSCKGRGLAQVALDASLRSLAAKGIAEARAVVTEGNTPSERLLSRCGFRRVDG